jgi:hypothetical protein
VLVRAQAGEYEYGERLRDQEPGGRLAVSAGSTSSPQA